MESGSSLCTHSKLLVYCKYSNCLECGSLVPSADTRTERTTHTFTHTQTHALLKDPRFNTRADVAPAQLYLAMLNDQYTTRFYNPKAAYVPVSPELIQKVRKSLVTWVCELARSLNLAKTTTHIAIAYLDYVLSKQELSRTKYNMVALTCLILAAKYDELDRNIPSLNSFLRAASARLVVPKLEEIKNWETFILRLLDWNLCIITPLVFVEMLLTQGVVSTNDTVDAKRPANPQTAVSVATRSLGLIELAFQRKLGCEPGIDYELLQFCPSVIAVACVVAARGLCDISPVWTPLLEFLTSYDYDQIATCHSFLMRYSNHLLNGRCCISDPVPPAIQEKVLELNQNIGNRLPATRPATTKATNVPKAPVCGKRADESRIKTNTYANTYTNTNLTTITTTITTAATTTNKIATATATTTTANTNANANVRQTEERFNIKAKKAEMENIKQSIKDKLVALNNKSRSIECLLEEDNNTSTSLAFLSSRAPIQSHNTFSRDPALAHNHGPQLQPLLVREHIRKPEADRDNDDNYNHTYDHKTRVPPGHIEFLSLKTRERPGQMHRPNSSFIGSHLHSFYGRAGPDKEKENALSKLPPGFRTTKATTSRDIAAPGSIPILLKQRSMRI